MVFQLRVMKQKEEEERRITKLNISSFIFSVSELGSITHGEFFNNSIAKAFVCKSFGSVYCCFLRAAPIH